ncbi:MAG: hypothetical protein AB1486_03570 [Planctomycetota bacterium]
MNEANASILVCEPCPSRRLSIERLVAGSLTDAAAASLRRHIAGCERCQGYQTFVRTHASATHAIMTRPRRRPGLAAIRRQLRDGIPAMTSQEAARALTRLADWYLVRREEADPGIFVSRPCAGSRTVLSSRLEDAVQRLAGTPWLRAPKRLRGILESLPTHAAGLTNRSMSRALLDAAIELDRCSFPAIVARAALIREDDYRDIERLQEDWELMSSADDARLRAEALAGRSLWLSMTQSDVDGALKLVEEAVLVDPSRPIHLFNAWFFALILNDKPRAKKYRDMLQAHVNAAHCGQAIARDFRSVCAASLSGAFSQSYLAASPYEKALEDLDHIFEVP